jgi:hypothetical protein
MKKKYSHAPGLIKSLDFRIRATTDGDAAVYKCEAIFYEVCMKYSFGPPNFKRNTCSSLLSSRDKAVASPDQQGSKRLIFNLHFTLKSLYHNPFMKGAP